MNEKLSEIALGDLLDLSLGILAEKGKQSTNGRIVRFEEGSEREKLWQIKASLEHAGILAVSSVCEITLRHAERGDALSMIIPPEEGSNYFQRDTFIAYVFDRFVEVA